MADNFKEVFDISKLDEHTLGCVEYVLNSPAYYEVFEPYLRSIRNTLNQRLLNPSKERKEEHPDDFLRGGIVAIDGLLMFFSHIIKETQMERISAAFAKRDASQQYLYDKDRGMHKPVLGANETIDTYNPEEDY